MDATVQAFSELPTAAISDALDALGIATQPIGLKPLTHSFRLAGRAWTLKYRAIGEVERGTVGDYIDDIEPGQVVVLDNGGRLDRTVWGDILTLVAHKRGVAGTVINGICRDVARAIEVNYPIYSLDHWMRTGKDRVEVDSIQVPVSLGDVQVRPGDIIVGDADGIVVVPQSREAEVLAKTQDIERAEKQIEEEVLKGTSLREARQKFRYHSLQSAPSH